MDGKQEYWELNAQLNVIGGGQCLCFRGTTRATKLFSSVDSAEDLPPLFLNNIRLGVFS